MKAILEFDLPEEAEDHDLALNGWRWASLARDFEEYLKNLEEFETPATPEEIRNKLFRMAEEHGVRIWE